MKGGDNGGKGSEVISLSTKRVLSWNGMCVINKRRLHYSEYIQVESLVV